MSYVASKAEFALSGAEKLARQRQVAALARSQAHALQLKVVVVCGCVLVGALGFAVHGASLTSSSVVPPAQNPVLREGPSTARVGDIQVPYEGETCRHYRFDNKSGAMVGESLVACAALDVRPSEPGPSRTEAIMNAFKVK